MSIDYRSGIAIGWRLTGEEIKTFSTDSFEDLVDNGYLINIDHYFDNSDWVFGLPYTSVSEGQIDVLNTYELSAFIAESTPILTRLWEKHLPNLKHPPISLILYLEVY